MKFIVLLSAIVAVQAGLPYPQVLPVEDSLVYSVPPNYYNNGCNVHSSHDQLYSSNDQSWTYTASYVYEEECSGYSGSVPQPNDGDGIVCPAIYYECPSVCPDNCVRPTNSPCPFAVRPTCPPEVCAAVLCLNTPPKPCPLECTNGCDYINLDNPCCDFLGEPVCK
ncbi:hypothetical protein BD560DRAFT_408257 [Blakeslea trispora]|nr:hypothetical protein BD560DRAFT_408257 [Blakeslea trispora]